MKLKFGTLAIVAISVTGCATTTYTDQYGNTQTRTQFDGNAAAGIGAALLGAAAVGAVAAGAYYSPPPRPVYVVPVQPVYVVPYRRW